MNTEDTTKMLTEILEEFIIYMYNEYKTEDFNYEFILNSFVDCDDDCKIMLYIFNLFKKSIYYNKVQKTIRYIYFTYDDDDDDDIEFKFNEESLNDYKFITLIITRHYEIELNRPYMIDFINSVIDNLQPILK